MENEDINYSDIIDRLFNTFSGVVAKDVIATVVESFEGNLHQSANALMNITSDLNPGNFPESFPITPPPPQLPPPPGFNNHHIYSNSNVNTTYSNHLNNIPAAMSYSRASQQNIQPVPSTSNSPRNTTKKIVLTQDVQEIITQYKKGWRVLLLMRGPPGCGKTHLTRTILQMTIGLEEVNDYSKHSLSSDEYFFVNGVYNFDRYRLKDAHLWNQIRAQTAMSEGRSPVIIDNTNIEIWEMETYVRAAVTNGYIVHVVHPKTQWARNANQLFKRNHHNVPLPTIKRILDNMQEGITGELLIQKFNLVYPVNCTPPVLREYPPLSQSLENSPIGDIKIETTDQSTNFDTNILQTENAIVEPDIIPSKTVDLKSEDKILLPDMDDKSNTITSSYDNDINTESAETSDIKGTDYIEIEKRLEEFEKLEKAWDNGENWEDDLQKPAVSTSTDVKTKVLSKPKRNKPAENSPTSEKGKTFKFSNPCNDWSKLLEYPEENQHAVSVVDASVPVTEKISRSTYIESGDMEISELKNHYKIITTAPRDINIFYVPKSEKIPAQRMLDKSTSTNDEIIAMKPFRCQNEEQHFKAFRRMFSHISSSDLRFIFENCCGDVNWAVEIVVDGMENKKFEKAQEESLSEEEEDNENFLQCGCLAAYNIIPDVRPVEENIPITKIIKENIPTPSPKKVRKETNISDASKQLKRQIEKNVVISNEHYSEHQIKIRNARRGDQVDSTNETTSNITEDAIPTTSKDDPNMPNTSTSSNAAEDNIDSDSDVDSDDNDDNSCGGEVEKTININVGMEFINQLDKLFGRDDMKYPNNIRPNINASMSLLNEFNALWMESLMHQLEEDSKQTDVMIEQDAEFARYLVAKEEEMTQSGEEPKIPDFKEIMDMDFALSLYQKDVAEWRSKEPSDLAAKMTRDKLYNLFPEVAPEILSELLMAHENNFQNTVEVLLISTGRSDILEAKNGVSKFVMEKEIERKKCLIEEQRKALSEVEWPLLPLDRDVKLEDVERYRQDASRHLELRKVTYGRAQEYMQRGMFSVASYLSSLGAFHTAMYEQSNQKAANSLVHVNVQRCKNTATIDLHNFRVAEAKESLDLFLDVHIQKLKELNGRNGVRSQMLYFLTGRGKHSPAGPRVKPAVKKRLRERGFTVYELNPGLLSAKVTPNHKLSDEIA